MRKIPWFSVFGTLLILRLPAEASPPQEPEHSEIRPVHVLGQVTRYRRELDQLRTYMGSPGVTAKEFEVEGAEPREVYFQALTLFRKTERLYFEQLRKHAPVPRMPEGEIRPRDVHGVVTDARNRLAEVRRKHGLPVLSHEGTLPEKGTPDDVFCAIIQASRQANLMLDYRFRPSDVFTQVTVAIGYAERLLERFPGIDSTVPDAPEFEPNKKPADVYRRLLNCFEVTRQVSQELGLKTLALGTLSEEEIEEVTPSDVYDIASTIISELAHLHRLKEGTRPPEQALYPGRKFPSHVHQRAGILEKQLDTLMRMVRKHPRWLNPGGTGER